MHTTINFTPFPDLTTERLKLRRMRTEDCNEIFFLRSDERILRYIGIQKAETLDDARKYIEKIDNGINNNESIMWAICLKNTDKLVGTICLWNLSTDKTKAEIGYMLHPDFQGRGLMQEAVAMVIDYGFKIMRLSCIDADVDPNNLRSVKVSERSGFTLTHKSPDTLIYSLMNDRQES